MNDVRHLTLEKWQEYADRFRAEGRAKAGVVSICRTENTQLDFGWRCGGFTMGGEAYYAFEVADKWNGGAAHLAVSRTLYNFVRDDLKHQRRMKRKAAQDDGQMTLEV